MDQRLFLPRAVRSPTGQHKQYQLIFDRVMSKKTFYIHVIRSNNFVFYVMGGNKQTGRLMGSNHRRLWISVCKIVYLMKC